MRVRAVDKDKGAKAKLEYSFLNDEDKAKFSIDSNTGQISSKIDLAPEDGSMFHLEVLARGRVLKNIDFAMRRDSL